MNDKIYLQNIKTIEAPYSLPQKDSIEWLINVLARDGINTANTRAINLYKKLIENQNILSRRSALIDYTLSDFKDFVLFTPFERKDKSITAWNTPPLEKRMSIYEETADKIIAKAFEENEVIPSYIIDISCTGYKAPFPAQKLVLNKGWQDSTKLIKIGHMGCYASVPGINLAAKLCLSLEEREIVSVMSTELCSLHLDPLGLEPDQIISNILFSDGAARMDLGAKKTKNSLLLLDHYEAVIPNSAEYMSWELHDSRFHMVLSRKVVGQLSLVIEKHLSNILTKNSLKKEDIAFFAIHPGGPKIIDSIEEKLNLSPESVMHSKEILKNYGNMSSATIPHIWKKMMEDNVVKSGDLIVSMAFGPGLTVTMNLMQKS